MVHWANFVECPIGTGIKCKVLNEFTLSFSWSCWFPIFLSIPLLFIFRMFGNI